ncbi:hypothetical protein [Flavobacterium sp. UBA7682]|uniref:hypothetical protein n=1 Tax=Flavobacterium sp. UBA7682 TaxID=1946560 RepID=UPI0025BEC1EA|nr:hypothetical protein [Flavobacterium sp. UBA7682]
MKHFIFLLLYLYLSVSHAQNVGTALNMNKPEDLRVGHAVSEITTEMTFYNPTGSIEKKKEVATLNVQHYVTSELRYDENGVLIARLTRMFDSTGTKSLGRKLERWHKLMGYTAETSTHEYDANGYLIKTTERNQNQQVIMVTVIENDDHGNATSVITTDGNGRPYGEEKAAYDYANNSVVTSVYNTKGELLSETAGKINYESFDDLSIVKNEQGDVIKTKHNEYEYRYDKKGNWTQMIIYKFKDGKRVKQSEFRRSIKYRK